MLFINLPPDTRLFNGTSLGKQTEVGMGIRHVGEAAGEATEATEQVTPISAHVFVRD